MQRCLCTNRTTATAALAEAGTVAECQNVVANVRHSRLKYIIDAFLFVFFLIVVSYNCSDVRC